MNLSEPFIRRPVMTAVLTLSVILFGVLSYFQLPVNDLPAVDYPVIQVVVGYPGASPDTIANNIATPLERQFMQINGLEVVTSQSTQGVATFTLQFTLDKNIDAAATDVQTAISQATGSLPAKPSDAPLPSCLDQTIRGQLTEQLKPRGVQKRNFKKANKLVILAHGGASAGGRAVPDVPRRQLLARRRAVTAGARTVGGLAGGDATAVRRGRGHSRPGGAGGRGRARRGPVVRGHDRGGPPPHLAR